MGQARETVSEAELLIEHGRDTEPLSIESITLCFMPCPPSDMLLNFPHPNTVS
jgi:hypothetical protein